MIKGRKLDHIGLAVRDVEASAKWYQEVLGFTIKGAFPNAATGHTCYFLEMGDIVYEMYQPGAGVPEAVQGKIDHIALVSDDIEADYKFCVEQGYKISTNGIEFLKNRFGNGSRYFKIVSPTDEQIEFTQTI